MGKVHGVTNNKEIGVINNKYKGGVINSNRKVIGGSNGKILHLHLVSNMDNMDNTLNIKGSINKDSNTNKVNISEVAILNNISNNNTHLKINKNQDAKINDYQINILCL